MSVQRPLYAFNVTRQSFLSLGVQPAHTVWSRLRGLSGMLKRRHSRDAIWVLPSLGIHTFGLLFPIDVVYLDAQMRVIHLIEHLGPFRIGPIQLSAQACWNCPRRAYLDPERNSGTNCSSVPRK